MMQQVLDTVREGFTVYLAAGIGLMLASAWAAIMALRAERATRDPPWPRP